MQYLTTITQYSRQENHHYDGVQLKRLESTLDGCQKYHPQSILAGRNLYDSSVWF